MIFADRNRDDNSVFHENAIPLDSRHFRSDGGDDIQFVLEITNAAACRPTLRALSGADVMRHPAIPEDSGRLGLRRRS